MDPRYDMPALDLGRTSFPVGDFYDEDMIHGNLQDAKPFVYGNIVAPHDIRILWVFPRVSEGAIHCLLTHQKCTEAQYQAISYTWGGEEKTRSIMCNGGVLPVTENLFTLLNDLRNMGDPQAVQPMWIDAICIDQDFLPEREAQVRMMLDIYRTAMSTLVWLGPSSDPTDQAFELIDELYRASRKEEFKTFLDRDDIDISDLDHSSFQEHRYNGGWDAVETLLSFDWYERVWVCQEVAVSNETLVFCKNHLRPWDRIVNAAYWMKRLHFTRDSDKALHIDHVLRIEQYRKDYQSNHGSPFLELIGTSTLCKSTKELDKIYAILGLVNDIPNITSLVDYKIHPLDQFAYVTLMCVHLYKTLDILHLCKLDPANSRLPASVGLQGYWPSCVPDLADPSPRRRLVGKLGKAHWRYNTSKDKPAVISQVKRDDISEDFYDVCLNGIIFDVVGEVGSEMPHTTGVTYGYGVRQWMEFVFLQKGEVYLTARDLEDLRKEKERKDNPAPDASDGPLEIRKEVETLSQEMKDKVLTMLEDSKQQGQEEDHVSSADGEHNSKTKTYPTGEPLNTVFWRILIGNRTSKDEIPDKSIATTHAKPWLHAALPGDLGWWMRYLIHSDLHGLRPFQMFNEWVDRASLGTRIFRTSKGYLGTGPPCMIKGDLVCVLFGGQTPFVLRPVGERFLLLGDCYVHGIMEGEVMEMGLVEEKFQFV